MNIITLQQAKQIGFDGLSLALGTFDGLHIGHMALINAALSQGGQSAVLTFDMLPADYFYGEHRRMRLMTPEEKMRALENAGIDYLCVAHFDRKFAAMSREKFTAMLHDVFRPCCVVAGYNYTYGHEAQGDADTLIADGRMHGFDVLVIPPVVLEGEPVSATRIRECLEAGSVERASRLLGYPYALTGKVGEGKRIGTSRLGFPTANLLPPSEKIIPLRGVYGVSVTALGREYKGVCNIGVNPTVSAIARESIETHIIGLSEDLYGKTITIRFERRLRGEQKFDSADALKDQIRRDIESVAQ